MRASARRWIFVVSIAALGGCPMMNNPTFDVVFRDDFSGSLADGWSFVREDAAFHSISARNGFFRINTQPGSIGSTTDTAMNLLVREFTGDFIITTRIEFNPSIERALAGLVIRDSATGKSVVFGLTRASGDRGEFRGIAAVAEGNPGEEADRVGAVYDKNSVYLRLQRSGSTIFVSYSETGDGFFNAGDGAVSADLPDVVQVGIGAAIGEECTSNCDTALPADFDFFEIGVPAA